MPTYRLTLEYDGTRYHGWQAQRNARTVAGELQRAVARVTGETGNLGGAGRTDAGVHALAQTAHLRLSSPVEPEPLRRKVNDLLPADIHILSIRGAPERFHARHDATARSYLYQISRRRTALGKRFVWWVKQPLDHRAMIQAVARLSGRHDFAAFCERVEDAASTLVVVNDARLEACGDLLLLRLVASHFLWKMVRRLTGTLVQLGRGALTADRFAALLAAESPVVGEEGPAQWTAPASGLFLERVLYPGDPPLPPLAPVLAVAEERSFEVPAPPRGGASTRFRRGRRR